MPFCVVIGNLCVFRKFPLALDGIELLARFELATMKFIPGYMFKSISEREEEITNVLNKMRKGGEISA